VIDIVYDAQCGFCARSLRLVRSLARSEVFRFHDGNDRDVVLKHFPALTGADLDEAMFAITPEGKVFRGFFAFRRMMWASPWLYPAWCSSTHRERASWARGFTRGSRVAVEASAVPGASATCPRRLVVRRGREPEWRRFFQPTLSAPVQSLLRCSYGVLLFLTLAQTVVQARRFFVSDRWGGYAQSDRRVDLVQNPYALPAVLGLWMACAALITVGRWSVGGELCQPALLPLLLSSRCAGKVCFAGWALRAL